MSNTILTPDMITDEALRVLHQKLNFVGNISREYDDSFANQGAKIGNTLRIRKPIEHTVGTGATMATGTGADTTETSVTLTVNSQKHVPMRFSSNEMTMKIDDFSERHIQPAMARLAASIESEVLADVVPDIPNAISAGTKVEMADILNGRKILVDNLAGADRCACLDTQANVDLVDSLKGLFQDSTQISKQYREGMMGRTASFDFYENTLLPSHTTGAEGGLSNYLTNKATAQTGASLIVDTGTKTIKAGDVFTIADVYDVHPETKTSTGELKQFVVLADATGAGTLTISPAIIASGPYQNVSNAAANNKALTFIGAASTAYKQSLLFDKGFATFATADLVLPENVHMASRRVYDGISMRMVSDYSIVKDVFYTRIDVLYGWKILRDSLATRVLHT